MKIKRYLKLDLPKGQSAFLWGARKTGKSTYLKDQFPKSIYYDFLLSDTFFELNSRPALFREQLLAQTQEALDYPIILDEVQKIPAILNEVHWLIENAGLQFILCGSSARKLRRGHSNLLGGRAWRFEMLPLIYPELTEPSLLDILNRGLIPAHYLSTHWRKMLHAYTQDYLQEEVFAEGLARNLPAFSRFFEALGYCNGELINYSNLATDCGVDSKTIKGYFHILVDTLVGYFALPFNKRAGRDIISKRPKFYLFDVGVAGALSNRQLTVEKGEAFGHAFEHYVFMELLAYQKYHDLTSPIHYWRSKTGLEVDFVLKKGEVAIEVKGGNRIKNTHLKSLKAFYKDYQPKQSILVCNEQNARLVQTKEGQKINILPWRTFLERLWKGDF